MEEHSRPHTETVKTGTPVNPDNGVPENTGPRRQRVFLLLKASGITALAFLLSYLLTSPFTATLSALFSSPEKNDFKMSDLLCQIADDRPVRDFDDRIVILDIGNLDRPGIAEVFSILALCEPAAVAIDINFEVPSDNDSTLLAALSALPNVILPLGLRQKGNKFEISEKPFFYGKFNNVKYGAANFPTSRVGATVREYAESFPLTDGSVLPSFPKATALASGLKTDLKENPDNVETGFIRYHSKEIPLIHYEELEERAEQIFNKTVLVGTTTDAGDVYPTPIHSSLSGLEIHSYALSTILDGSRIERLPKIIADLIAVLSCFLIVWGAVGIKWGTRGLLLRFAQVVILYLLVWIGYSLLVDYEIVSDFSQAILMVTFGLFAFDLWTGSEVIVKWSKKKINNYRTKH
ncbi:MAG: CHASE2 domain-containing protein [Muribaculaceae bacterium]|nr:CHASE2 domain-containing protein [Muribaculaceae bacterium]